jgi:hypothetical protein
MTARSRAALCVVAWIACGTARADAGARPPGSAPAALPARPLPPCDGAPLRRTGTVFYYCDCATGAAPGCVPGDDRRAGTSPGAPRRSLKDAAQRFNDMRAGDTVALCRGGAWDAAAPPLANPRCRASDERTTCDLRDYFARGAKPGAPRPRINAGAALPAAFTTWNDDQPYEGYRFWNLDIHHTSRVHEGPRSFFMIGKQSHVDICGVSAEGGFVAIQAGGRDVTIRSSSFSRFGADAILGGGSDWLIESNTFVDNGDQTLSPSTPGQEHTIYISCGSATEPCRNILIRNNRLHTGPDGRDGYGQCRGVMLILRGWLPGIVVENNLLTGSGPFGCGALSLSGSHAYTEIHGAMIRRNRIHWGEGSTTLMQVDACQGCSVEGNVIDGGGPGSVGIISPQTIPADNSKFGPTSGTVIRDNSVRLARGGTGISVTRDGSGYVVENNAVWVAPGGSCFRVTQPTAPGHPFDVSRHPAPAGGGARNYCVDSGASPSLLWANPDQRDFRTNPAGPLAGAGHPQSRGQLRIGAAAWTADDPGRARDVPLDIGALGR